MQVGKPDEMRVEGRVEGGELLETKGEASGRGEGIVGW